MSFYCGVKTQSVRAETAKRKERKDGDGRRGLLPPADGKRGMGRNIEGNSQEGGDGGREPPSPTDEEEAGGEPPPRALAPCALL